MDSRDFITMVLIVFLSLWGALYLEADLAQYFVAELFIILLFIIAAVGVLYGLAAGKEWAWPSTSLFFLASLANCIFIYALAGNTMPFVVTSIINIVGIGAGASRLMGSDKEKVEIPELPPMPEVSAEPDERIYHVDESDLVSHIDVADYNEDNFKELETFDSIGDAHAKKRKASGKRKQIGIKKDSKFTKQGFEKSKKKKR